MYIKHLLQCLAHIKCPINVGYLLLLLSFWYWYNWCLIFQPTVSEIFYNHYALRNNRKKCNKRGTKMSAEKEVLCCYLNKHLVRHWQKTSMWSLPCVLVWNLLTPYLEHSMCSISSCWMILWTNKIWVLFYFFLIEGVVFKMPQLSLIRIVLLWSDSSSMQDIINHYSHSFINHAFRNIWTKPEEA